MNSSATPPFTLSESESAFQLGFISFLGNVKMFLLSICGCGHVHDPAGFGQHDGHDGTRAH